MDTSLFGKISKKRFAGALRALGGTKARDNTGDKRTWKFNTKTLNRFSRIFESIPDTIELVEQHTMESATQPPAFKLIDEREKSEESLLVSDTSDTSDTSPEDNQGSEKNISRENYKETGVKIEKFQEMERQMTII